MTPKERFQGYSRTMIGFAVLPCSLILFRYGTVVLGAARAASFFDIAGHQVRPSSEKSKNATSQSDGKRCHIAVYFINTFFFQNYQIPSSSLEKTLLVGDFLAVSKVSYGPRAPMTPLSFPLAQHTMPVVGGKSYIEKPQWKYRRLKGLRQVRMISRFLFLLAMVAQNMEVDFHIFAG